MRVLRTEGSERTDWIPRLCTYRGQPYAILSHRWFEDANHEVLFAGIEEIDRSIINGLEHPHIVKNPRYVDGTVNSKPGFSKLQGAARQAQKDDYQYLWIDTCCTTQTHHRRQRPTKWVAYASEIGGRMYIAFQYKCINIYYRLPFHLRIVDQRSNLRTRLCNKAPESSPRQTVAEQD